MSKDIVEESVRENESIKEKLRKEIKDLPEKYIAIVFTSPEDYIVIYYDILKILLNEFEYSGICVTLNKPAKVLLSQLKKRGIESENLYTIDCISKTAGIETKIENTTYIKNPNNLTEISINIKKIMNNVKDSKATFLILDSLSTLLIYNSSGSVLKFANFLTTRMKDIGIGGVFIVVEEELEKKFINQIVQFCDKIIRI